MNDFKKTMNHSMAQTETSSTKAGNYNQ